MLIHDRVDVRTNTRKNERTNERTTNRPTDRHHDCEQRTRRPSEGPNGPVLVFEFDANLEKKKNEGTGGGATDGVGGNRDGCRKIEGDRGAQGNAGKEHKLPEEWGSLGEAVGPVRGETRIATGTRNRMNPRREK